MSIWVWDEAERYQEALVVYETYLATLRRIAPFADGPILAAQGNVANMLVAVGRTDEALRCMREVHKTSKKMFGTDDERTIKAANNIIQALDHLERLDEVKTMARKQLQIATDALPPTHDIILVPGRVETLVSRGVAAAVTWRFRGRVAATPRHSARGAPRRRRGSCRKQNRDPRRRRCVGNWPRRSS